MNTEIKSAEDYFNRNSVAFNIDEPNFRYLHKEDFLSYVSQLKSESNDDWSELAKMGTPEKWLDVYEHYQDLLIKEDVARFWEEQFNMATKRNELKQKNNENVEKISENDKELIEEIRQIKAVIIHFASLDKMPTLELLDREHLIKHVVTIAKKTLHEIKLYKFKSEPIKSNEGNVWVKASERLPEKKTDDLAKDKPVIFANIERIAIMYVHLSITPNIPFLLNNALSNWEWLDESVTPQQITDEDIEKMAEEHISTPHYDNNGHRGSFIKGAKAIRDLINKK